MNDETKNVTSSLPDASQVGSQARQAAKLDSLYTNNTDNAPDAVKQEVLIDAV